LDRLDPARTELYQPVHTVDWRVTTISGPGVALFGPLDFPIQGSFTVLLKPGALIFLEGWPLVTYSFSQAGEVPPEARYLELLGGGPSATPFRLWLDDTQIAMRLVGFDPNFQTQRWRGDISAFAGRPATLKLSSGPDPFANIVFDAIQFVPEPTAVSLAFCGAVLTSLFFIRRSRKCLRQRRT
jgi:hypothetical protein